MEEDEDEEEEDDEAEAASRLKLSISLPLVDCNVPGSYTSTTAFHRGVGNSGPSNATVISPPSGAVMSSSTLTPVLASNFARSCGKLESPLPIIWNSSSMMLRGFFITTEFTMLALGEMNSRAPIDAGAASHDATPLRSDANVSAARVSVLPSTSRRSIIRYRTSPIPGGNFWLLLSCTCRATICSMSAQKSQPAPCW